jgi:hypothetical protein
MSKNTDLGNLVNGLFVSSANNVGIGTTSPVAKLHIRGGNNNSLWVDNDGSQYTPIYISNNGNVRGFLVWDNTNSILQLGAANANPLAFYTNSTERIRITSAGDVAIGNTSALLTASGRGNLTINGSSSSVLTLGVAGGYSAYFVADSTKVEISTNVQPMAFVTNGAERMRIASNGNVGIGTNNPTYKLQVEGNTFLHGDINFGLYGETTYFRSVQVLNYLVIGGSENITFQTYNNDAWGARMTINKNGTIQISGISNVFSIGSVPGYQRIQYGTGGNTTEFAFINASDAYTPIGASAFNTRSDYRLKEDLKEFNAINLIEKLKVYDFKWKDRDERNFGFMAHELQEIIPYVVTGQKDGMFEGLPHYQGLDNSKIVPILIQAIKELKTELDILKNK